MPDAIHCRHRLPSPETAGFCDVTDAETGEVRLALDSLKAAAARSPHLRCKGKLGTWNWTYRKYCETCPDAVREKDGLSQNKRSGNAAGPHAESL